MSTQNTTFQEKGFIRFFQSSAASFFISVLLLITYGVMQKWMQPSIGSIVIDTVVILPYLLFLVYMITGITTLFQKITKSSHQVSVFSLGSAMICSTGITLLLTNTIFQQEHLVELIVLTNVIALVYTLFNLCKERALTFYLSFLPFVMTLLYFPTVALFMGK
ncbi:hypothetical protein [Bacillus paranthracis]|uniref:hypothetical protein n=1 Tax=Bacillus paranthracis TaxID=2026186 RepID=UPI003D22DC2C